MLQEITVQTVARDQLVEITAQVQAAVDAAGVEEGLCVLYVPHTTAGICIQENADPDVGRDLLATLARLVPEKDAYRHGEGNADAHVKATLVGTSQTIPVRGGKLALGRWQGIYFCEFDGPRRRCVWIHLLGGKGED